MKILLKRIFKSLAIFVNRIFSKRYGMIIQGCNGLQQLYPRNTSYMILQIIHDIHRLN
jgi:hypothetical protein